MHFLYSYIRHLRQHINHIQKWHWGNQQAPILNCRVTDQIVVFAELGVRTGWIYIYIWFWLYEVIFMQHCTIVSSGLALFVYCEWVFPSLILSFTVITPSNIFSYSYWFLVLFFFFYSHTITYMKIEHRSADFKWSLEKVKVKQLCPQYFQSPNEEAHNFYLYHLRGHDKFVSLWLLRKWE